MAPLGIGQKRNAVLAFDSAVRAISSAHEMATSGDQESALSRYSQALETLRSDTCRRLVSDSLISESEWTQEICVAMLGKARSLVAAKPRTTSFDQIERMTSDVFLLRPHWLEAHEFMAELAVLHGQMQKARSHLNHLLDSNEHRERACFLDAVLDFENHRYEECLLKLRSTVESVSSLCYTARCYLRTGRFEEAVATLEHAKARFGENYECYYYLGCAMGHAGRYEDARRVFGQLSRWIPRRAEPMIQLGNVYVILGWMTEAEQCFRDALKHGPRDAVPAYYGLALANVDDSDRFNAHLENIKRLSPFSDLLRCAKGFRLERAGELSQAAQEYSHVQPDGSVGSALLAKVGLMRYRRGDFAGSVEVLVKASSLRPNDFRLMGVLGGAAALSGDYRLAAEVWSKLPSRRRADEKNARAVKNARLAIIAGEVNRGNLRDAIKELEAFYEETSDPIFGRPLADLYFAEAVNVLKAEPPDTLLARAHLTAGKRIAAHPRFDYCLAIADLIDGDNASAATRLYAVLAANAKNPGASYHLGIALIRSGDLKAAELSLRHGIAVALNQSAKVWRLKCALAWLLVGRRQWLEAAGMMRDVEPEVSVEASLCPTDILDFRLRCLAAAGEWQAAEKLVHAAGTQTIIPFAALVLVRRSLEGGRVAASLSGLEKYFEALQRNASSPSPLAIRATEGVLSLAVKVAADRVKKAEPDKAENILHRALSIASIANSGGMIVPEIGEVAREFVEAINTKNAEKADLYVRRYSSTRCDLSGWAADVEQFQIEMPIVFPEVRKSLSRLIQQPQFQPGDWDTGSHPDPVIVFDS